MDDLGGKPTILGNTQIWMIRSPANWEVTILPVPPGTLKGPDLHFLQGSLGLDGRPSPYWGTQPDFKQKTPSRCAEKVLGTNHQTYSPNGGFMVFFWGGGGDDDIPCRELRDSLANWVFVILASIPVFFTYTLHGTHIYPNLQRRFHMFDSKVPPCW